MLIISVAIYAFSFLDYYALLFYKIVIRDFYIGWFILFF